MGPTPPCSGTSPGVRSGSPCEGTRRGRRRRVQSRRGVGRHRERRPHHPDLGCPRRTVTGGPAGPLVHESRCIQPRRRLPGRRRRWRSGPLPDHGPSRAAAAGRSRPRAQCLASHPQQALLASGADDYHIIVWDPDSGRPLRHWAAHDDFVTALAYSADGSMLASGRR